MTITLRIGTFSGGENRLTGFLQFWLRYVHGFSPHFHCQRSLWGFNDPRFRRDMQIGQSFELYESVGYDYIYLCGVTAKRYPGLHLALAPETTAEAYAVTYNGLRISVSGARSLEIPTLPDRCAGMSRAYTTCVNWQFGVRYYGLEGMRRE